MGCVYGKEKSKSDEAKKRQSAIVSPLIMPVENFYEEPIPESNTQRIQVTDRTEKSFVPKKNKKVRETVAIVKKETEQGYKMINSYVITDFLGQGAFGKVKLGVKTVNNQEEQFALKIFKKSQLRRKKEYYKDSNGVLKVKDALADVKREVAVMKKISHPNLISLHEVIENPDQDKIIMVIDYAKDGQLIEWDEEEEKFFFNNPDQTEPLNEEQLRTVFRDCIKGMHYLHLNGIVHRDLKPQNILMSGGRALIADFGVSLIVGDHDLLDNTQGTYHFMPPEACDKDQVKKGYSGKSADVWALGVTFYCFIYLQVPFTGDNLIEILSNISEANLWFPDEPSISPALEQFIRYCLTKNVESRPTIDQLAEHPWIDQGHSRLMDEIKLHEQMDVSNEEVDEAYSISTYIRIKHWVNKWRSISFRKHGCTSIDENEEFKQKQETS